MRLGRDSQFSLMFWLGVALVVCRASHLPAGVGVRVPHSDGHVASGFTCFARGHFVSSFFSLALRRWSVSTGVVCTRRFRSGSVPLSYVTGVGSGRARVGLTVATIEKSGDLVAAVALERRSTHSDGDDSAFVSPTAGVTDRLWLPMDRRNGDVCMARLLTPVQPGCWPSRIESGKGV